MISPDLLHCLNLGVFKDIIASTLKVILGDQTVFQGGLLEERMKRATESIRQYARANKLPLRLHKFTKAKLTWKTRTYPEFKGSGYDASVCMRWLEAILAPHSDTYGDICTMIWAFNHSTKLLCDVPRWFLTGDEKSTVETVGLLGLRLFLKLASGARTNGDFLWRVKPKVHLVHHIFANRRPSRINYRVYSTWMDEDFLKHIGRTLKLVSSQSAQKRILQRWLMTIPGNIRKCFRQLRSKQPGV